MVLLFVSFVMYKQAFFSFHQNKLINSLVPYQYSYDFFFDKNVLSDEMSSDIFWLYQNFCFDEKDVCLSFLNQAWIADVLWIRGVQLASDENHTNYHKDLYFYLDMISSLQPYWQYPYLFWQYLLPKNKEFETSSYFGSGFDITWDWTVDYGEKWIKFLCDWFCSDYFLPRSLAFNYFYFLWDIEKSSKYYYIASQVPGAPAIFEQMPAIVAGRLWEHLGSAMIWYEQFLDSIINEWSVAWNELRYLKKAVYEYSLYLLQEADFLRKDCDHDINCLKSHDVIKSIINREVWACENAVWLSGMQEIKCSLLWYGFENWYISMDWKFVYPLESGFVYMWRVDVQDWWIVEEFVDL